jgi:heptosyltransferase-2
VKLLVRAPNWLGDIVLALPAIQTIRQHFAKATLTVAAPEGFTALCAAVPGVDAVLPLARGSTWRTWRSQRDAIRAGGFHLAILLTNSFGSAWVMAQAGVPERWGYRTDWRGRYLTRAAERPRRSKRTPAPAVRDAALASPNGGPIAHAAVGAPQHSHPSHQSRYYLALTEALGIVADATFTPIVVSSEARARAQDMLTARGCMPSRTLVGVAPGAAYGHAKRWPPESVADVMLRLGERDIVPVLLGAAGDLGAARAIESALADRKAGARGASAASGGSGASGGSLDWINLVGETDLPTLMGVLASCRVVLSNDSGAMHLASAVGRPVVAVFGPTNERATAPLGPHTIVRHDVWCRPCMLRECPIDHRCMRGIAPEEVFDRVMTWIDQPVTTAVGGGGRS